MALGDKFLRIDHFHFAWKQGSIDATYSYGFELADPEETLSETKSNSFTIPKAWLTANLTDEEKSVLQGLRAKLLVYAKANLPKMAAATEKADA